MIKYGANETRDHCFYRYLHDSPALMLQGARLDPCQIYHLFKHYELYVVDCLVSRLAGQRSMDQNYRSKTDSTVGN